MESGMEFEKMIEIIKLVRKQWMNLGNSDFLKLLEALLESAAEMEERDGLGKQAGQFVNALSDAVTALWSKEFYEPLILCGPPRYLESNSIIHNGGMAVHIAAMVEVALRAMQRIGKVDLDETTYEETCGEVMDAVHELPQREKMQLINNASKRAEKEYYQRSRRRREMKKQVDKWISDALSSSDEEGKDGEQVNKWISDALGSNDEEGKDESRGDKPQ